MDASQYGGDGEADVAARVVRDEVRAAVQAGIEVLLAEREGDRQRGLLARLWHEARDLPQLAADDPDAWLVSRAFEAWSEHGVAGAAAWMSRWVQLSDPPEWPGARTWRGRDRALARLEEVTSELGATSAEVTEARTTRDRVLVGFELRSASGAPTAPSGFAALFEVDADQILRMAVFLDRRAALDAVKKTAERPT